MFWLSYKKYNLQIQMYALFIWTPGLIIFEFIERIETK